MLATTKQLCCVGCGYLDDAPAGTCPHCGEAVFDLSDPDDYASVEYLMPARHVSHAHDSLYAIWGATLAIVVLDLIFFKGYSFLVSLPLMLALVYLVNGIRRRRLPAGARQLEKDIAIKRLSLAWRILSSMPVVLTLALFGGVAYTALNADVADVANVVDAADVANVVDAADMADIPGAGMPGMDMAEMADMMNMMNAAVAADAADAADVAQLFPVLAGQPFTDVGNIFYYHVFGSNVLWHVLYLFVFGLSLDLRVSRSRALLIFLAASVAGGAAHMLWGTGEMSGPVAGVLGLAAAQITAMPNARRIFFCGVAIPGPAWMITPLFTVTYLAYIAAFSSLSAPACLAGASVGLIGGWLCRRLPESIYFIESQRRIIEGIRRAEA